MTKLRRLPIVIVMLIPSLLLVALAAASEAKTLHLELPAQENGDSSKAEGNFETKYEEILQEITISKEAVYVVENIKEAMAGLKNLSADICQTQYKEGLQRGEKVTGRLVVNLAGTLVARLEFSAPSALRGQIIVIDQEKSEARSYMPVTNQITVQGLEAMGEEALSLLSVTDVATLFDFTQYEVLVLESTQEEGSYDYLLQVSGLEEQVLQVRVKNDTWVPYEILEYEKEKLKGKLELNNVALDEPLSLEEIRSLPDVKEFRL